MQPSAARLAGGLVLTALLASCGTANVRDSAPSGSAAIPNLPGDAVPKPEPRSRYGNGPVYEVYGKRYSVMPSGSGYTERGVASWYGKKFHGRLTSNREPYDMYAMTAAHKTLPLPTYVRVRNLRNDKSVVVRVNDRGPFVNNRIIDLSYAAAMKLDMVQDGTSLVEVTAITFDEPAGDRPVRKVTPSQPTPGSVEPPRRNTAQTQPREPAKPAELHKVFAQIGAFGDIDNAKRRLEVLHERGISNAFIDTDANASPALHRVRVGPIIEVIQFDVLVEELENLGIDPPYLVTE